MGADIKALKTRIRSVDSTMHLTRAMGLVASSKIKRATRAMACSRDYASAFDSAVGVLASSPECRKSPYMKPTGAGDKLIVIAGDRGMCGGYNSNIFKLAKEYGGAAILPIGQRACDRFGGEAYSSETMTAQEAARIARELCEEFKQGKFARLGIISTKYVSMMRQDATVTWILPLTKPETVSRSSVIFEPNEESVLDALVPEYVAGKIVSALRESFACEVAARRMAMDAAGKNAQVMIDDLMIQYNHARQNAITQEITEIVAGAGSV